MKKNFLAIFLFVFLLFCNLSKADLVWDKKHGWSVEGGVLEPVLGGQFSADNALSAMNEAKKAQEENNYWSAISLYKIVEKEYPDSVFAPEALYQLGQISIKRHQWSKAYENFDKIIKKYPDYPKFNQVVGEQYKVASLIQDGEIPYLWGWFPWFIDYNEGIKMYKQVVANAPYSQYAPLALMNIALLAEEIDKPEESIDALDKLINNYQDSFLAPDAHYKMAQIYMEMVKGPEYDQFFTKESITYFYDFLALFPNNSMVASAEENLEFMTDTLSRSKLVLGNFYYHYRNNPAAAIQMYNEAITIAPNSKAAIEAKEQVAKIKRGEKAPMTYVDWFLGRYENPTTKQYLEESKIESFSSEAFEVATIDSFIEEPYLGAYDPVGIRPTDGFFFQPDLLWEDEGFMKYEENLLNPKRNRNIPNMQEGLDKYNKINDLENKD